MAVNVAYHGVAKILRELWELSMFPEDWLSLWVFPKAL